MLYAELLLHFWMTCGWHARFQTMCRWHMDVICQSNLTQNLAPVSSTCRPHIVRRRFQPQKNFQVKSRVKALLKILHSEHSFIWYQTRLYMWFNSTHLITHCHGIVHSRHINRIDKTTTNKNAFQKNAYHPRIDRPYLRGHAWHTPPTHEYPLPLARTPTPRPVNRMTDRQV